MRCSPSRPLSRLAQCNCRRLLLRAIRFFALVARPSEISLAPQPGADGDATRPILASYRFWTLGLAKQAHVADSLQGHCAIRIACVGSLHHPKRRRRETEVVIYCLTPEMPTAWPVAPDSSLIVPFRQKHRPLRVQTIALYLVSVHRERCRLCFPAVTQGAFYLLRPRTTSMRSE